MSRTSGLAAGATLTAGGVAGGLALVLGLYAAGWLTPDATPETAAPAPETAQPSDRTRAEDERAPEAASVPAVPSDTPPLPEVQATPAPPIGHGDVRHRVAEAVLARADDERLPHRIGS